jgi:hypothetical protein
MMLYRGIAATAATAVGALLAYLGVRYPLLAPVLTGLGTGAGALIGKWLGIPIDGVLSAALATMKAERAVAVTAQALRSMPPSAASMLLGSLPPPPPIAIKFVGEGSGGPAASVVRTGPLDEDEPTSPRR